MDRCVALVAAVCLTAIAPFAAAQDLVYDDGGDHELSEYGALTTHSIVEVRDGPGGAPTSLGVTIGDNLEELQFRAYGTSRLDFLSLGNASLDTYESSTGTIAAGSVIGDLRPVNSWDQSHLIVRDVVEWATANDDSTFTFESGSVANFHFGLDQSTTVMQGGTLLNVGLLESSAMYVFGGQAGEEGIGVSGNAYLKVDGGSVHSSPLFGQVFVSGNGRADIHSGGTGVFDEFALVYDVRDMGFVQLFGSDFLLDGAPIGPGDITALPGGARRSGTLRGVLESGDEMTVTFFVSEGGVIRIVPEPSTGTLTLAALGLALAMSVARRRA
jgi:hypothetical protein